ncbi:hypothetical protein [Pantoea sp. GbtcB22]|uniref:hypothetical protein n=1 Tax=Pantoea sp. GbtcB22 TaxID=2824767 RepID=UPI001C2FAA21|nr:hypothetical protein [Pantoea sp. GbtcB22]
MNITDKSAVPAHLNRCDSHGLPFFGPDCWRAGMLRAKISRSILSWEEHQALRELKTVQEKEEFYEEAMERKRFRQQVRLTAYYPARPIFKQVVDNNAAYPEWADKHFHGD